MDIRNLFWLGRRRDLRATVCAHARVVPIPGEPSEHLVANLSAGGALLIGRGPSPGARLRMALALPERVVKPAAQVVRADARGFAVEFLELPAAEREAIEQEVLAALHRPAREAPRILVLESARARADALLARIGELASIALCAHNPVDASSLIDRWKVRYGLVGPTRDAAGARMRRITQQRSQVRWFELDDTGRLRAYHHQTLPDGVPVITSPRS